LIYDFYPEALVAAGLIGPWSPTARLLRFANAALFRSLDAIITIGRDVEPLLLAYRGARRERIHVIPNWTLLAVGYREISAENRFRRGRTDQLVVGLSGNLGFTHCPATVFEAAKRLDGDPQIHFLLSGWGVGWQRLKEMQRAQPLDNVTLLEPVAESELVELLAAADLWIIPYRRGVAGVSIPSRLYNLLAVGRAIIVAAEPRSEAALVVAEENIGWVVPPQDADALAAAIRGAAADRAELARKGRGAARAAAKYSADIALTRYRDVILGAADAHRRPSP
jgi:glycosyltransferase involved in cell wall biosynthesis